MSGHHRASPNPPSRAGRSPVRTRVEHPKNDILGRIDIEHEYELMGVRFGGKVSSKGWRPCYSRAREERKPSAGINIETGHYKDHAAEGGESLTFWDFAIRYGNIGPDFPSVLAHFADKAGVKLQTATTIPSRPREPSRAFESLREPSAGRQKQPLRSEGDAAKGGESKPRESLREPSKARDKRGPSRGYPTADEAIKVTGRAMKATAVNLGWIYRSPDGSEAFRVVRYHDSEGKKTYRPFHRTPSGEWVCLDPPGLLPLYGLPELSAPGRIYIFEGEKVRDIARDRLGLLATTSSHGAGSAEKSDWSPMAGREVVIVPDAGKVGDKYAAEVVKFLGQLDPKPSIRLLKLPDLAEGEDLEQWLERVPELWEPDRCREEIERLATLAPDPTAPPRKSREELGLYCLADVVPQPVEWLWQDRIPRGKLTLIAGEGEIGKSFLTLDIIARLTTGRALPDRPDILPTPSDCVFVTAEDGIADTVVPRLIRLGADLRRVHTIGIARLPNGKTEEFTVQDIGKLEDVMREIPSTSTIVIDPIAAFIGRVDENKNAELRQVLGPLADFADRYRVAIVPITHFGKNPSVKASARILGSVAYSNAARVVWAVVPDPEDPERRLMLRVKNNLTANRTGMAYTIRDGVVEWEPVPVDLRAADVLGAEKKPGPKAGRDEEAIRIIREILSGCPLPSGVVIERCAARGVSQARVWAQKEAAGVRAKKDGFNGGWLWRLAVDDEGSRSTTKDTKALEGSRRLSQITPRPMPDDFKPEVCSRCKQPFGPRGYHAAWHGDEPTAECWDCAERLGA